jgi:hypothetical protein
MNYHAIQVTCCGSLKEEHQHGWLSSLFFLMLFKNVNKKEKCHNFTTWSSVQCEMVGWVTSFLPDKITMEVRYQRKKEDARSFINVCSHINGWLELQFCNQNARPFLLTKMAVN